jgi:hypothetical protein
MRIGGLARQTSREVAITRPTTGRMKMKIEITIFDGNCGDIDPILVAEISREMLSDAYPSADVRFRIARHTSGREPLYVEPESETESVRAILADAWTRACAKPDQQVRDTADENWIRR